MKSERFLVLFLLGCGPLAGTAEEKTAARVGGAALRTGVEKATGSSNSEVATAAVRALAEWPDDAAIPVLLSLAVAAPDVKRQSLAVRDVLKKAEAHSELSVRFASDWKTVRTRSGNAENKKTLDALFKVTEKEGRNT